MKLIVSILLFVNLFCATQSGERDYKLSKVYAVSIQGTSNLHDWSEHVEKVSGTSIVKWNEDGSFVLQGVHIIMEVQSIKSDNSIMDSKTYKALKENEYPEITFSLISPIEFEKVGAVEKIIIAKGKLTIAGITKPTDMKAYVSVPEQGKLQFQGTQLIKMSDFGIDPPTALFGTLKTGNEITLKYKMIFSDEIE